MERKTAEEVEVGKEVLVGSVGKGSQNSVEENLLRE